MDLQNNHTPHTKLPTNAVVYYWTNLAFSSEGHGLEQQKQSFNDWVQQKKSQDNQEFVVLNEFTDKHVKRTKPKHFPELVKAINYSIENQATLIIVKLNGLISQKEFSDALATPNLQFLCVDKHLVTPQALSVVRQYVEDQSRQHGANIRRGLRLTTNKLGNPNAAKAITPFNKIKTENSVLFALLLQPIIAKYQQQGLSQRKMVSELNDSGILAPEGGKWVLSQLQKVLKRIATNNLAIDLTNEIAQQNYHNYSASELIQKLNEGSFKPSPQENWDEASIKAAKHRNRTIKDVLELYDFLQHHGEQINNYMAMGNTLEMIAEKLNTQHLAVPHTLYDDDQDEHPVAHSATWSLDLAEKLIKRMTNELKLPYNQIVLKDFSDAITAYVNSSNNSTVKDVYNHDAVKHLLGSTSQDETLYKI